MERIIFFVCLCIAVEGDIGKHIFIKNRVNWTEAQAYCRRHHTDLSSLKSEREIGKLRKAASGNLQQGWIGFYRDPNNPTAWKWSGGGHITYQNWRNGQPDGQIGVQDSGEIGRNGKWYDANGEIKFYFYCIDVAVEEEKKSWEDALSHCRENQTDLPSLLSETDLLLAQTVFKRKNTTERVWIGLRFLGDRWLWVNGDPLEYEALPQEGGQDHQCPIMKRCGSLSKKGHWESWDCKDKLNFICV